jgi:hypothetical protein
LKERRINGRTVNGDQLESKRLDYCCHVLETCVILPSPRALVILIPLQEWNGYMDLTREGRRPAKNTGICDPIPWSPVDESKMARMRIHEATGREKMTQNPYLSSIKLGI